MKGNRSAEEIAMKALGKSAKVSTKDIAKKVLGNSKDARKDKFEVEGYDFD